jgi:hypothetical protein
MELNNTTNGRQERKKYITVFISSCQSAIVDQANYDLHLPEKLLPTWVVFRSWAGCSKIAAGPSGIPVGRAK